MKRTMLSLALVAALVFNAQSNQAHAGNMDKTIGTVIGAVGGGLLGSAMGKGKGRIVATAAGTVIGAVLGREIASNDYERDDEYRPRRRVVERERVVYREAPQRKTVVHKKHKKNKKWKRVAAYDGEVLLCNKKGKRCHWYD